MLLATGQYFGKTAEKLETAGIIVTQNYYGTNHDIPLHYHQNPHFCYFIKGGCSEFIGKNEFQCLPGDLIVHPNEIEHRNHYYEQVTQLLHVEFDTACYRKLNENGVSFPDFRQLQHPSVKKIFRKIYQECKQPDIFIKLVIESLIYELLINISLEENKQKNVPRVIKKVVEIMQHEYHQPIGLSFLALMADIQPAHLARIFKKATGCTLGEYLRNIRIEKARALLKNTKADLLSIALDCGFTDQSHFTQVFVKLTGTTPARYRKE